MLENSRAGPRRSGLFFPPSLMLRWGPRLDHLGYGRGPGDEPAAKAGNHPRDYPAGVAWCEQQRRSVNLKGTTPSGGADALLETSEMLAGLLVLAVLALSLWERAYSGQASGAESRGSARVAFVRPWRSRPPCWALALGGVLSFAASAPIWGLAPWLFGNPPVFWADDASHALVAAEIVAHGLPHGWIDRTYLGFPVGHHYPIGAWTVLSALIKLGFSPAGAASLAGWAGVALVPLSFYLVAVRAGARPSSATAGAVFLAWVSPYNAFVGGFEVYYGAGLLSQLLGLHAVLLLIGAAVAGRNAWGGPVAAALVMLCHPQLAVAAGFLLGIGLVTSARRFALVAGARLLIALSCAGAALYGQGIAHLRVPFGWVPGFGWRHLGFTPDRLRWWLVDGELFDRGRQVQYLTAIAAAALIYLLFRLNRPVPRAAAVTGLVALPASVSGKALADLGELGQALVSVLQPLRVSALLPVCAAILVVVAVEEAAPGLAALLRRRFGWGSPWWQQLPALAVMALLAPAARERFEWAQAPARRIALVRSGSCGSGTPAGYDSARLRAELGALSGGRLWYDASTNNPVVGCALSEGLDASTSLPIANTGAVGAHVGILAHAMSRLAPALPGGARRAEALGVRYLLLNESEKVASEWHLRTTVSGMRLYENPGVDRVGVGCIRETWRGSNRELAAKLRMELDRSEGANRLLDPERLIALEPAPGQLTTTPTPPDDCDPRGAHVVVRPSLPGAIATTVTLEDPADVVLRATAFPSWRVTIDGEPVVPRLIAPGTFAVRSPQGQHEIVAIAGTLPGYGVFLVLGALGVALASIPRWLLVRFLRRTRSTPLANAPVLPQAGTGPGGALGSQNPCRGDPRHP